MENPSQSWNAPGTGSGKCATLVTASPQFIIKHLSLTCKIQMQVKLICEQLPAVSCSQMKWSNSSDNETCLRQTKDWHTAQPLSIHLIPLNYFSFFYSRINVVLLSFLFHFTLFCFCKKQGLWWTFALRCSSSIPYFCGYSMINH